MNSLLQSLRTLPHNLSNLKPPHANSPADPLTLYSTNQRAATREVLSLSSTTKPINPAHILFPPIKPNKIPNSYQKTIPSHLTFSKTLFLAKSSALSPLRHPQFILFSFSLQTGFCPKCFSSSSSHGWLTADLFSSFRSDQKSPKQAFPSWLSG